ncbi:MAG: 2OG-Fe(II) oxygenase [Caulobacteraceae bacterium]
MTMETAREDLEARARAGQAAAQVQLAACCDAEGRHSDAIDWLARAAGTGDAEALDKLGVRLITGENAPWRPLDGAGLLVDAARHGNGQGAARVSVLAGGGFYGPQSWEVALDFLQRSAELNWAPAQDQLRLLGDGAALKGAPLAEVWGRLRRTVDLSHWTAAPASVVHNDQPLVRSVANLVPGEICDWIIAQSAPRLVRAEVHDPETGQAIMGDTRTNRVANFGLMETNLVNLLVQARIAAATGAPTTMMEAFAVLHYAVGEEASEHFDYLDPAIPAYSTEIAELGQRVATCLLYLNDGYSGGETAFPRLGLEHLGRRGDALIFFSVDAAGMPDPRSLHAGRPPTAGEKWVLSQFIRNKPRVGLGATRS